GILVEKDMATFESRVAFILGVYLELFIEGKHLGVILPGDGMLRLFPKQVRIPDVSFVSRKRMPGQELPKEKIWSLDPQDRTVRVYTSPRKFRLLKEHDTLDGGKVLPGFSLSIKTWFARASDS